MRYVIYGAGAIGAGIGGRLVQFQAQHGHEVILIARGRHLEKMQRDGLRMRAPGEDFTVPVTAVGHPGEIDWRGDEAVLLTMKTQDTPGALDDLRNAAGSEVPVVCAQNGVENERLAARRFANVYAMCINMPATYLEPGEVILQNDGLSGCLHAGRYPGGVDSTIEWVCAGLDASQYSSKPTADVMRHKYAKLMANTSTALHFLCGGDAETPDLNRALRKETLAVYSAAGVDCATREEVQAATAGLKRGEVEGFDYQGGSTMQSIMRGLTSIETDFMNGEIVLLANLAGVGAPVNRAIQDLAQRGLHEGQKPGGYTESEVLDVARRYGWSE